MEFNLQAVRDFFKKLFKKKQKPDKDGYYTQEKINNNASTDNT